MALLSFRKSIGDAIVTVLNGDADLQVVFDQTDSGKFKYRKHPLASLEKSWLDGAFVCPRAKRAGQHENSTHEYVYRYLVAMSFPTDRSNTENMEQHEAAIERVEEIFEYKSHRLMPATIRNLAATWASAGRSASVQKTDIEYLDPYMEAAFRAGYDVIGCTVAVTVLKTPFNSESL